MSQNTSQLTRNVRRKADKIFRERHTACMLCHRPFGQLGNTYTGLVDFRNDVMMVGDCCRTRVKSLIGWGVSAVPGTPRDQVQAAIEEHPLFFPEAVDDAQPLIKNPK